MTQKEKNENEIKFSIESLSFISFHKFKLPLSNCRCHVDMVWEWLLREKKIQIYQQMEFFQLSQVINFIFQIKIIENK